MSKTYEETGRVIAIDPIQSFSSGFTKQEFVIEVEDGRYPQQIKFEAVKERTDQLTTVRKGDIIKVSFNLRGNEYKGKYYVNLVAWKIDKQGSGSEQPDDADIDQRTSDSDDIPF